MLLRTFHIFKISVIGMANVPICAIFCSLLLLTLIFPAANSISLTGYRVESSAVSFNEESGVYNVPAGQEMRLKIFGENFTDSVNILFTKQPFSPNKTCATMDHTASFVLFDRRNTVASADILIKTETEDAVEYYMCVRDVAGNYHHLGDTSKLVVSITSDHMMPLPIQVLLVSVCLVLSSMFSGLNLGLMSLDVGELKLIIKCGSPNDKDYARAILPIRRRGNTLLCTLLFGNTIVNASLTLLLDDLIGQGIFALLGSTIGILIFGEIVPQSICSRYGLRVGYYCRFIVMFFMYGLFPITFALGKILDLLLGREIHQVYSREELREMVKMSFQMDGSYSSSLNAVNGKSGLKREEVNIVTGALEITEAKVAKIMKHRDEIFMLDISVAIDYDLIELITRHGYTRIPIFANGDRNNIVGLLSTKDLLGIDPEDKLPLNSLVEYYPRSILRVLEDTTILDMLNLFKTAKVHLAIVDKIICDEEHDPTKEMVGIVTLEDVIEFILREEIDDEADDLKERRKKEELVSQPHLPFKRADTIPQQLNTAAVQFLIANVEAFRKEIVERKVLANLLRFPGIFIIKKYSGKYSLHFNDNALYSAEKEADYFILVLQGSCQVYIGRERLPFEAGPFHYFGLEALIGVGHMLRHSHAKEAADELDDHDHHGLESISESDDTADRHKARRHVGIAARAKRVLSLISHRTAHSPTHDHEDMPPDYHNDGGPSQMPSPSPQGQAAKSSLASIGTEDSAVGDHQHKSYAKGSSYSPNKLNLSRSNSQVSLSSVHPAYQFSRKTFVPDFTVEITQDAQFVRLTNVHYRALLTVTQLVRRKDKLDDTAFIVEKLWSELVREGEYYPNFELVGPREALPASILSTVDVGVNAGGPNSSTRTTPPASNSMTNMLPLRVSIPNINRVDSPCRSRHSESSTTSVSNMTSPGLRENIYQELSISTPVKSRHHSTSPLQIALLSSSRNALNDSPRPRSSTSGDIEPLLATVAGEVGGNLSSRKSLNIPADSEKTKNKNGPL